MGIGIDAVKPASVKGRGAADNTVNLIAFGEQKLRQERTVLPGHARDQGFLRQSDTPIYSHALYTSAAESETQCDPANVQIRANNSRIFGSSSDLSLAASAASSSAFAFVLSPIWYSAVPR